MLYKLRRLINKIEKKFRISLFFLFPLRVILVVLERILLRKSNDIPYIANYKLNQHKLKKRELNIISAGVGLDISFEEKIIQNFTVKKIILVDPGEDSKNFVSSKKKILFEKAALFTEEKKMKIYKKTGNKNLSLDNLFNSDQYEWVNTITINQIMEKYNINKLDIMKLDVEGVADKVIIDCLEKNIFPDQICFELERPLKILKQIDYFKRFIKTLFLLKKFDYILYNCSNLKLGLRSEILAIKNEIR